MDDPFLVPAPGVLGCRQGNLIVLMSIRRAKYHTLDEVASALWDAIGTGARCTAAVEAVMTDFEVSDPVIADGLRRFIGELIDRGLLVARDSPGAATPALSSVDEPDRMSPSAAGAIALPRASTCVLGLTAIALALPVLGLERVWQRAHGRERQPGAPCPHDVAAELTHRVTRASSLTPLRTRCLEQSLFILWWLRRAGVAAHLRFGVQQYPFMAHAWVESAGVPLNDAADRLKIYRTFPLVCFEGR